MGLQNAARGAAQSVEGHARKAAHETRPWVEKLGRLGYAAKGVVYIVIGMLALEAALGAGGKMTDSDGALVTIVQQPFGKVLLTVVAVGLAGYALWRFVQGIADAEDKGTDAKGVIKRTGYVLSGLAYGALAVTAVQILRGVSRGDSGATQDWTARFLAQPFGQWLVAAAGLVVIALGINALYVAVKAKFREKLKLEEMSAGEQAWATRIGRVGLCARAVVFGVIGTFLIQAALRSDPSQARGLAGALKVLAQQSFGPWLLGAVAAGLIAYGVYMFVEARHRRMLGA